jgi:hypothetical protein
MKMFWKTEDRAFDKLLSAGRAQQSDPLQLCREFDPDLANAYIEHSLTTTEIGRYEQHLSACAHCRRSVVALSRMAAADTIFSGAEVKSLALAGESRTSVKGWFGTLSTPQWAMAAAAVLLIAISLPMLLSNNRASSEQKPASLDAGQTASGAESPRAFGSEGANAGKNAAAKTTAQSEQQSSSNSQAKVEREQEGPDKDLLAVARGTVSEPPPTGASAEAVPPAPQQPTPAEPRADSSAADQTASKTAEQTPPVASSPAPAPRQEDTQLPKINPEEAKSLAQDKDSAQVAQLKPGIVGGEEINKKEATIRDKDNIAPPPKPSSSETRGRSKAMTQGAPGTAKFRDSRNEAARSASGTVKMGGRKFWLRDDIWTDKDYNPDKEMPIVTIIRDSDVYRELLSKHSGMRPFLTGFAETARVIFVYKGTVYKLIPQEGSK